MRWTLLLPVALVLAGCGAKPELRTVHDKPVSHWLAELKQPSAKARKKAATQLGHVGAADAAAIPALAEAVKDRDAAVRREAVLALLNIGPPARTAVPALTEARQDRDATVRAYADKALQHIQGTP